MAQSPHARSEARSGKRSRDLPTFRDLALDHHLLFNFYPAPSLLSLFLPKPLYPRTCGVVERIVELFTNPQAVQKHRELSGHGHRRSLLCVLGSPRGYLLSMASEPYPLAAKA